MTKPSVLDAVKAYEQKTGYVVVWANDSGCNSVVRRKPGAEHHRWFTVLPDGTFLYHDRTETNMSETTESPALKAFIRRTGATGQYTQASAVTENQAEMGRRKSPQRKTAKTVAAQTPVPANAPAPRLDKAALMARYKNG